MVNNLIHADSIKEFGKHPQDSTTVVPIAGGNFEMKATGIGGIRSRRSRPTDIPVFDMVGFPSFDARAADDRPHAVNHMKFWQHTLIRHLAWGASP